MNTRFAFPAVLAAATLAIGLAGCAQQKKTWYKPGMTQDQWAVDHAECRSRARRLAEDAYTLQAAPDTAGNNPGAGYDAMMRQHQAKRSTEDFYRQCLARKGYRLVVPQPAPAVKT